jgi:hypothetical protein
MRRSPLALGLVSLGSWTVLDGKTGTVKMQFELPPSEIVNGAVQVYAIVDDDGSPHTFHECRTDNNQSARVSGKCDGPK